MKKQVLESDQSAYLLEAVAQIAEKLNFKPKNQTDLALWLENNYPTIISSAILNQRNIINKVFGDQEVLDNISETISNCVYSKTQPVTNQKDSGSDA